MDDGFFDEFRQEAANQVAVTSWQLYAGLTPPDPTGPVPAVPFRLAITVSAVDGHTMVAGTVTVAGEEIEFEEATRLVSSEDLTELPEISTEDLDCYIVIECITPGGAPIEKETLAPITVVVFPKTRILRDSSGSGSQETNYDVRTKTLLKIGDRIRYQDPHQGGLIDIYVKDISGAVDLEDNTQPFRVLYCA